MNDDPHVDDDDRDDTLVYTVAEVATRLKVSPGTVRNMIEQGQLYALRLHTRRIVVPKWALDDLISRPAASDINPIGVSVRRISPPRHRPAGR